MSELSRTQWDRWQRVGRPANGGREVRGGQAAGAVDQAAPSEVGTHADTRVIETSSTGSRSWLFRGLDALGTLGGHLLGIVSVVVLLAITASIPIVQLFSFGYLLEVSGRLARGGGVRDAMVGLSKSKVVGGILLGAWLSLLPAMLVSNFWFESYVIDPGSAATRNLRVLQVLAIGLTWMHIAAATMCGGKLRYFLWPLMAPVSFGIWLLRRLAGVRFFRVLLRYTVGLVSPRLPDEIASVQPIGDWFLPAIVWKRIRRGGLYPELRDRVWEFCRQLRPAYYFLMGVQGLIGSLVWLVIPTGLLVISSYTEGGVALLTFLAGVAIAIPVFAILPFVQAHFAQDGRLARFFEVRAVARNFGRAPLAHAVALLIVLVLALPLFLLKIENIPAELLWTLSLVFVIFSWPARIVVGWAYRRGTRREARAPWWIRYPAVLTVAPVSLAFVLVLTASRYVSWRGAPSLFENHVFLVPAPFWL